MVGGFTDNNFVGAAWVFTRGGNTWTQQGSKLVGTGIAGSTAEQGISVSLSADGNTAIVGGDYDNGYLGAAWVFTRSGSTWTQQGSKLVGTGSAGLYTGQGSAVALSADGNTAIVGGLYDNSQAGAAWVFTRSGSTWTQQGNKLVGTGAVGASRQGVAVSLSANGNTAILGGYHDNSSLGALWVYKRSGSTWAQQGTKLVGTGNTGSAAQGISVALVANGSSAVVGGTFDNGNLGAAWIFTTATPLSIHLSSINAYAKNNGAEVAWRIADETGGDHYEIERSADGKTFFIAGEVAAANRMAYTWYDARAIKGNNYYRIKFVEYSGEEI